MEEVTIPIIIHVPEKNKSVSIHSPSSLHELAHADNPALQRIAFSYVFFLKMLGYADAMANKTFSPEELTSHLEEYKELYAGDMLDLTSVSEDTIGKHITDLVRSDDFEERYEPFLRTITGEIFRVFACGAIAQDEGEVGVGSSSVKHHFTKA